MKLATAQLHSVETSGVMNTSAFTIKASPKAFSILTSNLYSNKPLAIIRELCCNAYDAHVASGNADKPIEINLPNSINPTLSIKDYGTGLDDDEIRNVYTTFFESTKTESDDYVGQLGLGSKAPFSMFNSFNVESRKGGVKRLYTAYINDFGVPTIAKMGEEETTEPNGVTVSMAVNSDDFSRFKRSAEYALMYFNPKPIVSGSQYFNPYEVSHTLAGKNWKTRTTDYDARMFGAYVVQGFVPYPIDKTILTQNGLSDAGQKLIEFNIDFFLPIGSVDVSPSREALSYDKRTIQNLIEVIEDSVEDVRVELQAKIDEFTTHNSASRYLQDVLNNRVSSNVLSSLAGWLHKDENFLWNGLPLTGKYDVEFSKIELLSLIVMAKRYNGKISQSGYRVMTNYPKDDVRQGLFMSVFDDSTFKYVIDDSTKYAKQLHKLLMQQHSRDDKVIMISYNKNAQQLTTDTFDAQVEYFAQALGGVEIVKLSSLVSYTPPPRATATRRSKTSVFVWNGTTTRYGEFYRKSWDVADSTDVDFTKPAYYVMLDDSFSMEKFSLTGSRYNSLMSILGGRDIIDDEYPVYAITKSQLSFVKDDTVWIDLYEHAKEELQKLNLQSEIDVGMMFSRINDLSINWALVQDPNLSDVIKEDLLPITVAKQQSEVLFKARKWNTDTITFVMSVFCLPYDVTNNDNKARDFAKGLYDIYVKWMQANPMLNYTGIVHRNTYIGPRQLKDINEYCEAIKKSLTV
jgi:hypothetical protein